MLKLAHTFVEGYV